STSCLGPFVDLVFPESLWLRVQNSYISKVPFLTVWNAPTGACLSRYGVDLDLGTFNIVQNQNQTFMGDNMTIFYSNKLGFYPWYSSFKNPVNGGVPQNASLDRHLRAACDDIRTDIPDGEFEGLAVVDWESWRPVWERNWDSKQVYWEASRALVRAKHPDWTAAQVEAEARAEFEDAARKFMQETLKLGQQERPDGLWGFYGFPNCYNYYSPKTNYSGECPADEVTRNDQLLWLWNTSSALYPDLYLGLDLRGLSTEVRLYTHHRILEALRFLSLVSSRTWDSLTPVSVVLSVLTRLFLQEHLVYTVGESAALGAAGVVLWGDGSFSKSKAACEAVKLYVDQTLGSYLVNVTSAASLCSQALCSSQGRCRRTDPGSRTYLHLDPAAWKSSFQCVCFPGWSGESCSRSDPV
uniref:Hyaluronidase n=1 Tax=Cynoglossus semilaevis TaxID=244447 RepID=A0A3P8X6C5_CYNSE